MSLTLFMLWRPWCLGQYSLFGAFELKPFMPWLLKIEQLALMTAVTAGYDLRHGWSNPLWSGAMR
jgi:hypothetical protein